MLKRYSLLFLLLSCSMILAQTQSTGIEVYNILQTYCSSCHNADNPPAGLNFVGVGANDAQRWTSVYQKIVHDGVQTAYDPNASGGPVVYPGRPDWSFLFRKINQGLEPLLSLGEEEGQAMPPYGETEPSQKEVELIRQWILYGAPMGGEVVDKEVVDDYYDNFGLSAFPDGGPAAPDPSEGFQIKMGPFYLEPGTEVEYFQRYELELPDDLEVTRLDIHMAPSSHHFIVFNWENGGDSQVPHGLRENSYHNDINLVAAVQASEDLKLPQGTAFSWENDIVLDLNSHYINYSSTQPYQAEAYVNVYTQPKGTAAQEMQSELLANVWIPIPNNGNEITHRQTINYNLGELYIWGLMGHTHQYGTGYKVWTRENGLQGELIYDAGCPQGTPGCAAPFFDYQHIPYRTFEPLKPIRFDASHGIIHEAKWINDGPIPLNFGPTSQDEMMVLAFMFTTDTSGIVITNTGEVQEALDRVQVYPNPAQEMLRVMMPPGLGEVQLQLYDTNGRKMGTPIVSQESIIQVPRAGLPAGMYFYEVRHESGLRTSGRCMFQ